MKGKYSKLTILITPADGGFIVTQNPTRASGEPGTKVCVTTSLDTACEKAAELIEASFKPPVG